MKCIGVIFWISLTVFKRLSIGHGGLEKEWDWEGCENHDLVEEVHQVWDPFLERSHEKDPQEDHKAPDHTDDKLVQREVDH